VTISAKRQEAHSPARSDGVAAMDDPITAQIREEVAAWDGVTVEPHRFGGIEFRVGRRELGHLHGNYLADLPFPVRIRERLVAEGRAQPHHILPDSGWISYSIRDASDASAVVALFRLNFERPWIAVADNTPDTKMTRT
jgi:Family of unknown function (DUF5519)